MTTDAYTRETNVYGSDVSEVYDLVYKGRGKDYAKEAAVITGLIRDRNPGAASLLDVACGTGEHLRSFATIFDHVEGLELSDSMRALARRKLPDVAFHSADIRRFELGRSFDGVCSMFGTLGYMSTIAELEAAVAAMARHLNPGGVLIVEPWYFADRFLDGHVGSDLVKDDRHTVARMAKSVRIGDLVRQEAHWIVADVGGIRTFQQIQIFSLFQPGDYTAAFERAGCAVEYLERDDILDGRGLFIGVRR